MENEVADPLRCREPFLQGGIYNSFKYNNWVLAFNLTYSLGSKIRLFGCTITGDLFRCRKNLRQDWEKTLARAGG